MVRHRANGAEWQENHHIGQRQEIAPNDWVVGPWSFWLIVNDRLSQKTNHPKGVQVCCQEFHQKANSHWGNQDKRWRGIKNSKLLKIQMQQDWCWWLAMSHFFQNCPCGNILMRVEKQCSKIGLYYREHHCLYYLTNIYHRPIIWSIWSIVGHKKCPPALILALGLQR